jgi:hypothetical protein
MRQSSVVTKTGGLLQAWDIGYGIRMKRFMILFVGIGIAATVVVGTMLRAKAATELYAIHEPHLTCEQATQVSTRTIERLGYTLGSSAEVDGQERTLSATRPGATDQEKLTVKIVCSKDGVRVDAIPAVLPCEQANQRAKQAMEQLQFRITSFSPAAMGKRGVIKGTRERPDGQETTMATIHCSAEAVHIEASEDSPLLNNPEFLKPISDVRRGFFALFKPMAAALVKK